RWYSYCIGDSVIHSYHLEGIRENQGVCGAGLHVDFSTCTAGNTDNRIGWVSVVHVDAVACNDGVNPSAATATSSANYGVRRVTVIYSYSASCDNRLNPRGE